MVTQHDNHNQAQAMLLINKLLGPNAAANAPAPPPPPHIMPGAPPLPPPSNSFGPYNSSTFPPFFPPAQPPLPVHANQNIAPEKMNYPIADQSERSRSGKSYKRKSHKQANQNQNKAQQT